MANKALAKRQKLTLIAKPSKVSLKPRNPLAIAAKQRLGGPHVKTASAKRQVQNKGLRKMLKDDAGSGQE